jgi:hypothetical protein
LKREAVDLSCGRHETPKRQATKTGGVVRVGPFMTIG